MTLTLRVGSERDVEIGIHIARGDGVDIDALAGPLVAQRFGQSCDSMFARGIGWYGNAALDRQQRGYVDNLPTALLHHLASKNLAKEKYGSEIYVDDGIPIFNAEINRWGATLHACVVDQDIDVSKAC